MTKIVPAPVFYILTNRLGFVSRKCRFVPHVLTETLREDRLVRSIELLPILVRAEQISWHFILTGDESWFFCDTENSRIWLAPDAETSKVAWRLINMPKIMVTIFGTQIASMSTSFWKEAHHSTLHTSLIMLLVMSNVFPLCRRQDSKRNSLSFISTIHPFTSHVPFLRKSPPCVSR
jgi:hypothetical protein